MSQARPPIGIRQLRADVAAGVRRAGAGEHIVISIGGRPIAQLGPLGARGTGPTQRLDRPRISHRPTTYRRLSASSCCLGVERKSD